MCGQAQNTGGSRSETQSVAATGSTRNRDATSTSESLVALGMLAAAMSAGKKHVGPLSSRTDREHLATFAAPMLRLIADGVERDLESKDRRVRERVSRLLEIAALLTSAINRPDEIGDMLAFGEANGRTSGTVLAYIRNTADAYENDPDKVL